MNRNQTKAPVTTSWYQSNLSWLGFIVVLGYMLYEGNRLGIMLTCLCGAFLVQLQKADPAYQRFLLNNNQFKEYDAIRELHSRPHMVIFSSVIVSLMLATFLCAIRFSLF